jgi:maleylacetoacetate isomerase
MAKIQKLTLYYDKSSSASFRVRAAMSLKKLDMNLHVINLASFENRKDAYFSINPQGMVPCLKSDCGMTLGQSVIIIDWLEENYPDPSLYPMNAKDRYLARNLIQQIACDVSPYQKRTLQRYLKTDVKISDEALQQWLNHWILRGLNPIETILADISSESGFAFEDRPTVFECYLYPQMMNAKKWNVDTSNLVHLQKCISACDAKKIFTFHTSDEMN